MKYKSFKEFNSTTPCKCGGNCQCGTTTTTEVNESADQKKFKQFWDKSPETAIRKTFGKDYDKAIDNRVSLLLTIVNDPDDAEKYSEMDFLSLPSGISSQLMNMDPKDIDSILDESIVAEGKSYQEKFKDEASAYQEMINDPSKRVYDIVDFAQFTTGGMTEKQWEMFMYGRYKKNLQSKDSKTKEKMYKVLTKWLSESSVTEAKNDGNLDTIEDFVKQVLDGGGSFMDIGKMLKGAYKYDFSTGMMPMYVIPVSGNKIVIINKKYVENGQADRVVGDIAIGLMESVVTEKFNFSKKEVEAAANLIASAISQADKVKAKVHDLEYDKGRGAGFEISIDGEKYDGGSYVVKDNGDVVNVAIGFSNPNAVYNTIGNKDIADVFINMEKYESLVDESVEAKDIVKTIKAVSKIHDTKFANPFLMHEEPTHIHKELGPVKIHPGVPAYDWRRKGVIAVSTSLKGSKDWQFTGVDLKDLSELPKNFKLPKQWLSESVVTEKLARGLKPLLTIGSTITKKDGEAALLDLSDKFDELGDEDADNIASWLNMAIELHQDGYLGDATKKLKQFNKTCKDVLNGKEVGSAFESVTEATKHKFSDLAKAWDVVYGEDLETEYPAIYQEVIGKLKNKVTKKDLAILWNKTYGEDLEKEYDGFFGSLKENIALANKIDEVNSDGTISDDEDDDVENMLTDVEFMVDELLNYIKVETKKIGGSFRAPGMEAQCLKLIKETFKKHKVRL